MTDRHVCRGLWVCETHPKPYVVQSRTLGDWWVVEPRRGLDRRRRKTFQEALTEARAMAVGE